MANKTRNSRGEIKIEEILKANSISYSCEYEFDDLKTDTGRPLRFDFAVFDDDGDLAFLIEYQGEQHYHAKSVYGGRSGLNKQQFNDRQKVKYCKKHNIKLLVIPYWEFPNITINYLLEKGGYFD